MEVSFAHRSTQEEIMDNLDCEGEVVNQTLRELDFINQWLGGNAVTVGAFKRILPKLPAEKPVVIADLGCGSGEMLRTLARVLSTNNRKAELIGIDANANIIDYATKQSTHFSNIRFYADNVFDSKFQQRNFDVVLATLFLHHFSTDDLITLLRQLSRQSKFIIINDIHRHPLAYYSIQWLTQLLSKSAMVKFDAPLSVLRSFTRAEWQHILKLAGLDTYTLRWKWAFRWQIVIQTKS